MNPREKILVGVVAALALVVTVGFTTNFGNLYAPLTSQNEKPVSQVQDPVQPESKLEYAAINADSKPQNSLTVLFKKVENSVVQLTTKVST
ncbi:MAG: hypothetical protein HZC29_03235, partial [Thaumarchaeota archaeon]|nr:hypothetical protein [Nitrososphaerota archaeon]